MKALPLFLLVSALFPLVAFAAPGAGAESPEEVGKIAEIAGKFGVTGPTLAAQIINFVLVAVVLYFFAVKPVVATLEERRQKIADGLQYAEEMKLQLAEAERERAEKVKEAAAEARQILNEAREQSKVMLEQKTQEAVAKAEAIIRKAGEATEMERQKMLADVRQEVAALVVATASKVLSRELSDADRKAYADTAVKELAS